MSETDEPLRPWMRWLLRFAGCYNLAVAANMIFFHRAGQQMLGLPDTGPVMPWQLSGLMIGIFGVGYLLVARRPLENRNILWLGLTSKVLGPLVIGYHVLQNTLPPVYLVIVFFSDVVYWLPFAVIGQRLNRLSQRGTN